MHEPGADRHAYLLLAPLALGLAAGAQCLLATRAAPVAVAVVLACVAGAAGLSDRRIPLWHNQWSLWSTTVAQAPDSARAQHNLAGLLFAQGAYSHAREHLRAAIRADPGLAASKLGLAAILCAQGRRFRAQRKLARARVMGMAEAEVAAVERSCTAAEQQP